MKTLQRFIKAQEHDYDIALAEIRSGHKRGHWIWYIFPQIAGLGYSSTAEYYAIKAKDKELYEKDINEGDWVYFDLNDEIFKEK